MTEHEKNYLLIRGVLTTLPSDQQEKIKVIREQLLKLCETEEGQFALVLVGAELAAK